MERPVCPHCGQFLIRFELPDNTGWQGEFQLACFNDECPYFVRGWEHMKEHYAARASYRHRIDPTTGHASPLAVWSYTALRDRILDEITEESISPDDDQSDSNQGSPE